MSLSLSISASMLTLLVPFLWRTLTNTGREVLTLPSYKICGLQVPKIFLCSLELTCFECCQRVFFGMSEKVWSPVAWSWEWESRHCPGKQVSHQGLQQADKCGGWGAFCQLVSLPDPYSLRCSPFTRWLGHLPTCWPSHLPICFWITGLPSSSLTKLPHWWGHSHLGGGGGVGVVGGCCRWGQWCL